MVIMNRSLLHRFISVIAFATVLNVQAQPVGERLLDNVDVSPGSTACDPELAIIKMHYPVRYVTHYPQTTSDEVRIRIRPLRVSQLDRDALIDRESTGPDRQHQSLLNEVIYEGDFQGGPYLTLIYNQNVATKIIQGSDFRSIKVLIYPPDTLTPDCKSKTFFK